MNVRFDERTSRSRHVRFTANNGHSSVSVARPLSALADLGYEWRGEIQEGEFAYKGSLPGQAGS